MNKIVNALAIAAIALSATPAMATPAAKSLSVAKAGRAATPATRGSRLSGGNTGPIAAALITAGIIAGTVVLIVDKEDDSDSN